MIELISQDHCVSCNICVRVCPRDVFDAVENNIPVIARKSDCQSCFMCELYCPTDALYVAPHVDEDFTITDQYLSETGLLGSFAKDMGWKKGKPGGTDQDPTRLIRQLRRETPVV